MGDPFYRMNDDGTEGLGMYDRLDLSYEPHIGRYLSFIISARFHFHNFRYSGCQQVVGVKFNINEIVKRK